MKYVLSSVNDYDNNKGYLGITSCGKDIPSQYVWYTDVRTANVLQFNNIEEIKSMINEASYICQNRRKRCIESYETVPKMEVCEALDSEIADIPTRFDEIGINKL